MTYTTILENLLNYENDVLLDEEHHLNTYFSRRAKRSKRRKNNYWKKQQAKRSAKILDAKWTKAQHDDNMTYEEMHQIDMRCAQAQKKAKRFFKAS